MVVPIKRFTFGLVDDSLGSTDGQHVEIMRRKKEGAVENGVYSLTLTVFNPDSIGNGESNERSMISNDAMNDRKVAAEVIDFFESNGIQLVPQPKGSNNVDRLTHISRKNAYEELIRVNIKEKQISPVLELMAETLKQQAIAQDKSITRTI